MRSKQAPAKDSQSAESAFVSGRIESVVTAARRVRSRVVKRRRSRHRANRRRLNGHSLARHALTLRRRGLLTRRVAGLLLIVRRLLWGRTIDHHARDVPALSDRVVLNTTTVVVGTAVRILAAMIDHEAKVRAAIRRRMV